MIDVKTPLRTAYFQLLNGQLKNGSATIPVSTDVLPQGTDVNIYVILRHQSSVQKNRFTAFISEEKIITEIIFKASARVNTEIIDAIAGQIMNLICPTPTRNGLPAQAGIQILNVALSNDNHLDLQVGKNNVTKRRILTFAQTVVQT